MLWSWLSNRLKEPSFYAGTGVLLSLFGVHFPTGWTEALPMILTALTGVAAVAAPSGATAAANAAAAASTK